MMATLIESNFKMVPKKVDIMLEIWTVPAMY
jgi:hypothetical protein